MTVPPTRLLVLGASGMLGHTLLTYFARAAGFETFGVVRSAESAPQLLGRGQYRIEIEPIVDKEAALTDLLERTRPDVIINCIGVIKQLTTGANPLVAIPINALLPHRIARAAMLIGARTIHISTDCVFSGLRGRYTEADEPDATDLYGRTKLLGEIDYPNAITLRTSLIGHELSSRYSLVDWFLGQNTAVTGFRRAVFSGVPTIEMARIIHHRVLPHPTLHGLYHVSASPISKHELLTLIGDIYNHSVVIAPSDTMVIDRSLDSTRFRTATGYVPPPWPTLIRDMLTHRETHGDLYR